MSAVTHPCFAARRANARATTWWGKAWVRAVEESAYAEPELRKARTLSRGGNIGGITVGAGSMIAAVREGDAIHSVSVSVPVLEDDALTAFVELVSAESGRIAGLLAGDLPHQLVEHAEESGVEMLPYGGELESACTCGAWIQPCVHALGVTYQFTWLIDADPLVLLQVRGLSREELLAQLHARTFVPGPEPRREADDDLEAGLDAALRAARILELLDEADPDVDHLF